MGSGGRHRAAGGQSRGVGASCDLGNAGEAIHISSGWGGVALG